MGPIKFVIAAVACALVVSSCGGGGIQASNCTEIAEETMLLLQRLIDDVDAGFGEDRTVQAFLDTGGDLPSVERFEADADAIDSLAIELGCTETEIGAVVTARVVELTATTDLGRFIIDAIRSGGL
jgi:hypothetical protein